MRTERNRGVMSEINVTPFVDVMLVPAYNIYGYSAAPSAGN